MTEKTMKYKLILFITMTVFGTIGVFRRYLPFESGFIAMSRGFVGMLSLLAIMFFMKKKIAFQEIKKNAFLLLISGSLMGLGWILLFEAYNHTTVAVATLCYYMAPIFVILVSPLVLKEKFTLKKLICIFMAFVGMVLVSGILNTGHQTVNLKGVLFGLISAAFYAAVVVIGKAMKNLPAFDKVFVQLGVAAIILLPYVLIKEDINSSLFNFTSVITLLIVGIVNTGICYALYFYALEHLPAQTVAIFSYIDPLVAVLCSIFILSEKIGSFETIGMFLIIMATLSSEVSFNKPRLYETENPL